jgi:hypothetical protein
MKIWLPESKWCPKSKVKVNVLSWSKKMWKCEICWKVAVFSEAGQCYVENESNIHNTALTLNILNWALMGFFPAAVSLGPNKHLPYRLIFCMCVCVPMCQEEGWPPGMSTAIQTATFCLSLIFQTITRLSISSTCYWWLGEHYPLRHILSIYTRFRN